MPRKVFVHAFKTSHEQRRKFLKSAEKKGTVKQLERTQDGWLYEVPANMEIPATCNR